MTNLVIYRVASDVKYGPGQKLAVFKIQPHPAPARFEARFTHSKQ